LKRRKRKAKNDCFGTKDYLLTTSITVNYVLLHSMLLNSSVFENCMVFAKSNNVQENSSTCITLHTVATMQIIVN